MGNRFTQTHTDLALLWSTCRVFFSLESGIQTPFIRNHINAKREREKEFNKKPSVIDTSPYIIPIDNRHNSSDTQKCGAQQKLQANPICCCCCDMCEYVCVCGRRMKMRFPRCNYWNVLCFETCYPMQ